jgi:phage tail protein X
MASNKASEQDVDKKNQTRPRVSAPEQDMGTATLETLAPGLATVGQQTGLQAQAAGLNNPNIPMLQRQEMARGMGARYGNLHMARVVSPANRQPALTANRPGAPTEQEAEGGLGVGGAPALSPAAAPPKPPGKQAPIFSRTGRPSTTRSVLPNGQTQQTIRTSFTQVIARSDADNTEPDAEQMAPEEPIIVGEVGPPQEAEVSSRDSVNATATHVATVNSGGPVGAGNFGTTGSSIRLDNVVITPGSGTFAVTADLTHNIWWGVLSGTGPSSQVDIQDENDADIKACNYQLAASDLTPNMSSDNGRPPRTAFWAEDLTIRHERFHAEDQRELSFGPTVTTAIENWLNAQTATSATHVQNTLLPQAMTEGIRVYNNLVALPTTEGDAYGDGAPLYQARADAIKNKGDVGDYGLIATEVTVLPKGGEEYEIVEGDTLWAIAERTYGHGRYWRDIYRANPGKAQDGGNLIFPGTVLDLPSLNPEQELSITLSSAGQVYISDTVTVNGSHTFFVLPNEIFSDSTNCTGNVVIDLWDADSNLLLTTPWTLPGTASGSDSNFQVTASLEP